MTKWLTLVAGILLAMTVFKAWGHNKLQASTPITALLLRDGTFSYFLVLGSLILS